MKKSFVFHFRQIVKTPGYEQDVLQPKGGATVALQHDPESKITLVASAVCSPNEPFNRRVGHQVSTGRLAKCKAGCGVLQYENTADSKEAMLALATEVVGRRWHEVCKQQGIWAVDRPLTYKAAKKRRQPAS